MCDKKWTLLEATKDYFNDNHNRRCNQCEFCIIYSNYLQCKVKRKKCDNIDATKCKYFTINLDRK